MIHTIGISEMKVSNRLDDILVTYSLGSCIGLSLYDPIHNIGGMIHCMLPLSKIDVEKAGHNPEMFIDTGVPSLLRTMFGMGAGKNRIVAKVAGAANIFNDKAKFNIGERNYTVLRKILWKNNILLSGEDIGGIIGRYRLIL